MGMIFGKESVAEPTYKVLMKSMKTSSLPYEIRQYGDRYAVQTTYPIGTSTNEPFRKLAQYIGVFGTPNNTGQAPIDMTAPVAISTTKSMGNHNNNDGGTTSASASQPVSIAMTAPVAIKTTSTATTTTINTDTSTMQVAGKQQVMSFYLPAIYNEHPETIPQPIDPDVTIQCIPGAIGAVHRFSGTMGMDPITTARDKANQLRQQLDQDGITSMKNTGTTTDIQIKDDTEEDGISSNWYEIWQYNPPFTIPAFRRNEIWMELTKEQLEQLVAAQQQETTTTKETSEIN